MTSNIQNINNLEAYYQGLERLLQRDTTGFRTNTDREHNATVMRFFMDNSKSDIRMFCGEMSLFRDGFYDKIEEMHGSEVSHEIKRQVVESLKRFIEERGHKLKVIIENKDNNFGNDFIDEVISTYIKEKKIVVNQLPEDFPFWGKLNHFTVVTTPKLYRFEIDKEPHEAICVINAGEHADTGLDNFNILWSRSNMCTIA